jgi:hypothetical protein
MAVWDYGGAVHAAFIDSLADLTHDHLDKRADMRRTGLGVWQGRDIELHGYSHAHVHGGEIAVLKGLQGAVGWI